MYIVILGVIELTNGKECLACMQQTSSSFPEPTDGTDSCFAGTGVTTAACWKTHFRLLLTHFLLITVRQTTSFPCLWSYNLLMPILAIVEMKKNYLAEHCLLMPIQLVLKENNLNNPPPLTTYHSTG